MTGNPRSSGYALHPEKWYREPRAAIDALLDVEPFHGTIWDPACGSGNIPIACKHRGYQTIASDIVDRGYLDFGPCDFLTQERRVGSIITNPPFDLAVEFVLHGLTLAADKVCILQRTGWLEGKSRYQRLFASGRLARVWQFQGRLSMPPGDSAAEARGGSVAYAWFCFEPGHSGPYRGGWV